MVEWGVLSLALSAAALGQTPAPSFTYGFEALDPVVGLPGQVKTFDVHVTLATADNPLTEGAQGWSLAVGVEGGAFRAISLNGVVVDTLFDADQNAGTPPIESPLELAQAGFKIAHLNRIDSNQRGSEAVSAIVLNPQVFQTLLPEGTVMIARLTVEATIPPAGECASLTLRHIERSGPSLKSGGIFHPVVTWRGMSVIPALVSSTVLLCPGPVFVRCDPNLDGKSDVADSVWILNELFQSGPRSRCPDASDCNGDGRRDIADALYGLEFQFMGGPPPPAPFPACGRVEGETTFETCPEPPSGCPGG